MNSTHGTTLKTRVKKFDRALGAQEERSLVVESTRLQAKPPKISIYLSLARNKTIL